MSCLPWELLYRAETRDFLSRHLTTTLVRHLEVPQLRVVDPPKPPLRVLVAISNPPGTVALDTRREHLGISTAFGADTSVELVVLEQATLEGIRNALRDGDFQVLHFTGHGTFDHASGEGSLILEDAYGRALPASGRVFAETLKGCRSLRLVVLNACETARLPRLEGQDLYSGVASGLVMGGIPAVVSMQYPISDSAAICFSRAFYGALAAGDLIESAMVEGRLAIHQGNEASWEWATPILHMSMDEGRILAGPATEENHIERHVVFGGSGAGKDPGSRFREKGAECLRRGDFEQAATHFGELRSLTEANPEDVYSLALAKLAGRRPRKLDRSSFKELEKLAIRAVELSPEPCFLLFLAFLKYDYYPINGLRDPEPSYADLLHRAQAAEPEPKRLKQLLSLLPPSDDNPAFRRMRDPEGGSDSDRPR